MAIVLDPAHYSSQGVREQTAELASLALSLNGRSLPNQPYTLPTNYLSDLSRQDRQPGSSNNNSSNIISSSEPTDLVSSLGSGGYNAEINPVPAPGSSALTEMIRNPSSDLKVNSRESSNRRQSAVRAGSPRPNMVVNDEANPHASETTSLISKRPGSDSYNRYGITDDVESQGGVRDIQKARSRALGSLADVSKFPLALCNPKRWDRRSIWNDGVVYPISLLPSVFLGLLLNVLDALSYGLILFPLGEPLFSDLGSDGISMFYVSTIVSQLFFSCGGSIFKGGIGSEMIEVVPFFHKMAFMILNRVGEDNPRSVLATTVLSFSISSVLTGLVFLLMGTCKLGSLIGFFPRHILIGCIGGVGWFLVATGVEVAARLPGPLEYTAETLKKLVLEPETLVLWIIPLGLAVGLLVLKRFIHANFLVGAYFIAVALIFYLVKLIANIPMDTLREAGWVFASPPSSNPWYHFYTLYGKLTSHISMLGQQGLQETIDFSAVDWTALADTIPAMFALTFFGILHVPINVPALGISTGEDNLNVDQELMAHGVTNALSGFLGSVQVLLAFCDCCSIFFY